MDRTIKLRLEADQVLVDTVRSYNQACNVVLKKAFKKKTFNKLTVHHLTYEHIRKKFPKLQSSLVCALRDQACDMLKREKLKTLPIKKENSGIRYNARTFTPQLQRGFVTLSSLEGRLKKEVILPDYFKQYIDWNITGATLCVKNGSLFLHMNATKDNPKVKKTKKVLGIDRGVINPIVTSDNQFFNSRKLRAVKGRYRWLKACLQKKGTRSAKRRLKRLSGRENRFVRDTNHCLSKVVAGSESDTFALEKLNIRTKKSNGRRFNKLLGNWSYRQFQQFLEYKVEAFGKSIVYVNPRHTSQCCSVCGNTERSNRHRSLFKCGKCGFSLNADLNASRNIAQLGKALLSRLPVNQPIVAPCV